MRLLCSREEEQEAAPCGSCLSQATFLLSVFSCVVPLHTEREGVVCIAYSNELAGGLTFVCLGVSQVESSGTFSCETHHPQSSIFVLFALLDSSWRTHRTHRKVVWASNVFFQHQRRHPSAYVLVLDFEAGCV